MGTATTNKVREKIREKGRKKKTKDVRQEGEKCSTATRKHRERYSWPDDDLDTAGRCQDRREEGGREGLFKCEYVVKKMLPL